MSRLAFRLVLGLALLSLVVVGCASAAPQPTATATTVSVSIKGADGKPLSIDSSVPDELKSLPVPQGFKSDGGGSMSVGGDKLSVASWKGTGTVQAAVDFYKTAMVAQGWKEDSSFLSSDGGMLNYSKTGDLGLTLTISKEESGGIAVAAMLGKGSPKTPTPAVAAKTNAAPTAGPTATPDKPQATSTPQPPAITDVSSLPAELKDIPVPSGFALVKDGTLRMASGGKLTMAMATWFGKSSVKDVTAFYLSKLPSSGWNVDTEMGGEDTYTIFATSKADASLTLSFGINKTDAGTEFVMQLYKQ